MDLTAICQKLPPSALALLWAGYAIWEYGIGKTKWGSSIGLFIEAPINATLKKLGIINGPQ